MSSSFAVNSQHDHDVPLFPLLLWSLPALSRVQFLLLLLRILRLLPAAPSFATKQGAAVCRQSFSGLVLSVLVDAGVVVLIDEDERVASQASSLQRTRQTAQDLGERETKKNTHTSKKEASDLAGEENRRKNKDERVASQASTLQLPKQRAEKEIGRQEGG